jgi:hypothetical protein
MTEKGAVTKLFIRVHFYKLDFIGTNATKSVYIRSKANHTIESKSTNMSVSFQHEAASSISSSDSSYSVSDDEH